MSVSITYSIQSTIWKTSSQALTQYSENLRSTSNELLSDVSCSQFDTELDPGLISLAQQAKRKDVQNHEGDKVRVLVRLVYHPETVVDDHNRAAISQYERPMIFIMRLVSILV